MRSRVCSMRRRDQQLFEFKRFLLAHATTQRACSKPALDHSRWSICGQPHWPLSTVKQLHVKHKRDMPLVRDVTTTVAQSWTQDARASQAAFLDENPEASIAEVARHYLFVTEQLSGGPRSSSSLPSRR